MQEGGLFYESHLARMVWRRLFPGKSFAGTSGPVVFTEPPAWAGAANPAQGVVLTGLKGGSMEALAVMEAALKKAGAAMTHEGIVTSRRYRLSGSNCRHCKAGKSSFAGSWCRAKRWSGLFGNAKRDRSASGEQERSWETSLRWICRCWGGHSKSEA